MYRDALERRVVRRPHQYAPGPILLLEQSVPVGISFDQAGINGHTLAADQAPRNRCLEQVAQQFTLSEMPMPVLRKSGMIRHKVV